MRHSYPANLDGTVTGGVVPEPSMRLGLGFWYTTKAASARLILAPSDACRAWHCGSASLLEAPHDGRLAVSDGGASAGEDGKIVCVLS